MDFKSFLAKRIDSTDWEYFKSAMASTLWSYKNLDKGCAAEIKQNTKIPGLKFDFNFGLRMDIPKGKYHVKIRDVDSGTIFFDDDISDERLISVEKNYIHWDFEVTKKGKLVYSHTLELNGKPVLIDFLSPAIGDTLCYLPYIRDFKKIHNADLKILLPESLREFAAHVYPELEQVDVNNYDSYATFYPMVMMTNANYSTFNFNALPMEYVCVNNLNIPYLAKNSKFTPTMPREISDPYVCIAVQASAVNKTWLYPNGWEIVVDYLKKLGYRVLCIDRDAEFSRKGYTMKMPNNAENFTGNRSIMNRANMLYHAEFFIGLGSGLSWLARAVECPVVLIAGFSQDWCEFHTPYRIANRLVCNGCFNDNRVNFPITLCAYHCGTDRELECSKKISPRMVTNTIEDLIVNEKLKVPARENFVARRL